MPAARFWTLAAIILVVGAALRFAVLTLVPLHHDEGVNGFFLTNLVENGVYKYDPTNYHGPTLYYLALPFVKLLGLTTTAVRLETAIFGVLVLFMVLLLDRALSRPAVLVAAAFLALSPGMVYISRYFIHEMLFLFFTLGILVPLLHREKLGIRSAVIVAAASMAMLTATKETAEITIFVFLVSWGMTEWMWRTWGPVPATYAAREAVEEEPLESSDRWLLGVTALLVFISINVIFYSSFFTNAHGILDAFRALKVWEQTGESEFHRHPFLQYVWWTWRLEFPILVLGAIGCVTALLRIENRFAIFCSLWSMWMFFIYSTIKYKTPWLFLNAILPLAIVAGYQMDVCLRSLGAARRTNAAFTGVLTAVCCVLLLVPCCDLNFVHYDGQKIDGNWYQDTGPAGQGLYGYVYAHTTREINPMVATMREVAKKSGQGDQASIAMMSDEYWPLPWYLHEFKNLVYYQQVTAPTGPPPVMIVVKEQQLPQVQPLVDNKYYQDGTWNLRPGLTLYLYVRNDVPR
ncbi:MAG: flippase activity-associated protein Agl23 [Candidatus Xenobia bacterium]